MIFSSVFKILIFSIGRTGKNEQNPCLSKKSEWRIWTHLPNVWGSLDWWQFFPFTSLQAAKKTNSLLKTKAYSHKCPSNKSLRALKLEGLVSVATFRNARSVPAILLTHFRTSLNSKFCWNVNHNQLKLRAKSLWWSDTPSHLTVLA